MASKPINSQPRRSRNKDPEAGDGQRTPLEDAEVEGGWLSVQHTDPSSKLLKQVEDLQAAQKKMTQEQAKLKQQLEQKKEEIARLCEQQGAEGMLQSGEYHSARSTPYTSLESKRGASSRPSTGPHSKEGGRLLQELDDYKSQIGRFKKENAELRQSVDTKHKRIVDLEKRLDIAAQLQPEVERLTMELSKYQQGGEDSGTGKSDSAEGPSQHTPQEESYWERLKKGVDVLRPYKTRAEEAEKKFNVCEKEYHLERRRSAKLQNQIDALELEIAILKSRSGPITNIDDYEVLDATSQSTEHKASLEREEEKVKEGKVVKQRDSKRGREGRQEAMIKEQSKEWKRSLSENDQEMEKMGERDREWEQRLEEEQHEWEERMQTWQNEKDMELQEKRKEIRQLKNKVKELEKAADMLGKVQRHSKGQSQQLMQLQDEAMAKDDEADAIRRSMEGMQDQLEELQSQNQELAKERGQLREENKRLQKQMAKPKEFTKEHGQWKEAKLRLEGQVAKLEADISIQIQEKEKAQNELRSITTQCNDWKKENLSFREELKKISSLHHENQQLYVQVNELTQATEDLSKERDALKDTLQTTEAQVQVFKEDFEAERSDRVRAHSQRNEEGERYKQEISRLQTELGHTQQQLKSHKGNLSGLEDVHQRRQKELMHALEQLKAAQEEVQAKTSQVKQYKKQVDQTTAELASLKAENKELVDHFEVLRQEIERKSKGEEGVSKTEPKAMRKHNKKEAAQAEHLQQELKSQAALVQTYRQKSKERKAKIAELEVENSGLKQEMKRVRREAGRMSEKLSKEKEKKKKTASTSDISISSPVGDTDVSTQIELAELREENRKLQDDNDDLMNEVKTLRHVLEDLKKDYLEPSKGVDSSSPAQATPQQAEACFSHSDDYLKGSSGDETRPVFFEESQATAGKGNFRRKHNHRQTTPHETPQGPSTSVRPHSDRMPPKAHVAVESPRQSYSQQGGRSPVQQKEPLQAGELHADYVNQSRVQAMIEESKAQRRWREGSPEFPHSAPMPGEAQFDLPPPIISYSEEVASKSRNPATAMNQGSQPHVQGNIRVQQEGVQVDNGVGQGGSWNTGGGGHGGGGGRYGGGGGGHGSGARLGGQQQRGMEEHHFGDQQRVLEDQYGPTSLPTTSYSKAAAYKHQHSAENPGRLRSGSNPEQHAHLKKNRSPAHVPYDPLTASIDTQMHDVAEYYMDEEGREHPVTGLQAPIDPNLACPVCGQVFREGEIQLYRRHVATCGTEV